jgi:hypothetical protein
MKNIAVILFSGLFLVAACSSTNQVSTTPVPQPTPTEIRVFPTPSAPGNSIGWDKLQVTLERLEITPDYMTDYGSTRIPPEGDKFLWVQIRLRNTSQIQTDVPLSEHYSILYAATEIKPSYGHRQGYSEYITLEPLIFPNEDLDGWLRFDIPTTAELNDLRFVFLPESSHVGASYSSPNYPYTDDKPIYVWNCEP